MFLFKRNLKEATDVACFMFSGRSFQARIVAGKKESYNRFVLARIV